MARARNIKPGFYRDAALVELPIEARLLFPGLWMLADRAGRLEDKPKQIKMEIYPADCFDVDVLLNQLQDAGLIVRYVANGIKYIQVVNFDKHQNPHRDEKPSIIPAPELHGANTVQARFSHCGNRADSLIPDSLIPEVNPLPAEKPAKDETELQVSCKETWASYSAAYQIRYGVLPVRNQKINSQVKQFCQRISADEAPLVASFYVSHNLPFYGQKAHAIGQMLADAEKLRMEWITKNPISPQPRASPAFKTIHDQRAETIAALTGRNRNERTTANERDITGEAIRVA